MSHLKLPDGKAGGSGELRGNMGGYYRRIALQEGTGGVAVKYRVTRNPKIGRELSVTT